MRSAASNFALLTIDPANFEAVCKRFLQNEGLASMIIKDEAKSILPFYSAYYKVYSFYSSEEKANIERTYNATLWQIFTNITRKYYFELLVNLSNQLLSNEKKHETYDRLRYLIRILGPINTICPLTGESYNIKFESHDVTLKAMKEKENQLQRVNQIFDPNQVRPDKNTCLLTDSPYDCMLEATSQCTSFLSGYRYNTWALSTWVSELPNKPVPGINRLLTPNEKGKLNFSIVNAKPTISMESILPPILFSTGMGALCGLLCGFIMGGPFGAVIGASIGLLISIIDAGDKYYRCKHLERKIEAYASRTKEIMQERIKKEKPLSISPTPTAAPSLSSHAAANVGLGIAPALQLDSKGSEITPLIAPAPQPVATFAPVQAPGSLAEPTMTLGR